MTETNKLSKSSKGDAWQGLNFIVSVAVALGGLAFVNWHPNEQEKAEFATTNLLCKMENVCSSYPDLRDVCATAGSFDKCMEVKYGTREKYDATKQACTNDGKLQMDESKIPGTFSCWLAWIKG